MMTAAERDTLYANFLAAIERCSLKTAMAQCKKAFEAGPTYRVQPFVYRPIPQPTFTVSVVVINSGE